MELDKTLDTLGNLLESIIEARVIGGDGMGRGKSKVHNWGEVDRARMWMGRDRDPAGVRM